MTDKPIPVISLFSGPGGMDLGFEKAGFAAVFAADVDPDSVTTFNRNRGKDIAHCVDIAKIVPEDLLAKIQTQIGDNVPRGVIGGPPCQAFSLANVAQRKRDPRKRLLLRYAEIVKLLNREYQLDFIVFENVPGLNTRKHSRYLREFKAELVKAGFNLWQEEVNAKDYGVPQKRRRLFVIGINRRLFGSTAFRFPPQSRKSKTVRDALWGLPKPAFFSQHLPIGKIPKHPNHWTMRPRSAKFGKNSTNSGRSFRRLSWDKQSWAVAYGNREIHLHPRAKRRLSVYEAMMLQGFPKSYRLYGNFSAQVTQVSNAVPVPLAAACARAIADALYKKPVRVRDAILAWHENHKRYFPWRRNRTPYRVLIAEKLLQQTRATHSVVSAYQTLIERYPDISVLSRAAVVDLRQIFNGLGFNYRAEELLRLAQELKIGHRGEIPSKLGILQSLTGIGDYSARAILCFGFNQQTAIVDANISRLLCRVYGIKKIYKNPARSQELLHLAESMLPKSRSADFNYAILDFCALVCKAQNPNCAGCPLKNNCNYAEANAASR